MPIDKENVEPASFCSFCGVRGQVVVSEQIESAGVRICGPCVTWARDELRKADKGFPRPTAEELARPPCETSEIAPGMTATMLPRKPKKGPPTTKQANAREIDRRGGKRRDDGHAAGQRAKL